MQGGLYSTFADGGPEFGTTEQLELTNALAQVVCGIEDRVSGS
jgi:hypothetical protein